MTHERRGARPPAPPPLPVFTHSPQSGSGSAIRQCKCRHTIATMVEDRCGIACTRTCRDATHAIKRSAWMKPSPRLSALFHMLHHASTLPWTTCACIPTPRAVGPDGLGRCDAGKVWTSTGTAW